MTIEGTLYRVTFGYVCAGVIVSKRIIVHAPPILGRFTGRQFSELLEWVIYRWNGQVVKVGEE